MALFSCRLCAASVLLLLASSACVLADQPDDEAVTVETEEEEQYHSPIVPDPKTVYLAEHFDDETTFKKRWIKSEAKKQGVEETIAKYDGQWELQEPTKKILKGDLGLVLTTEAKHAAISTLLDRPFIFSDKPLVVQYEVTMQEGQNCGGAYLKLLSRGTNTAAHLRQLTDQTPYTIMFGPDKCGNDHKLHFIFRHVNPLNGTITEKHCKKPSQRLDDIYKDKEPHLYTLVVRPDNTFSVLVDRKEVNAGSLLEHFTPPVNPPDEVDDPDDTRPQHWDEREKIVDPSARKPDDWDESAPAQIPDPNAVKPDGWLDDEPDMIPDPAAVKPSDWDEDMDGSWEAPLIDNPACAAAPGCGPWAPPMIPNPAHKGPWRAPLIPNPNYKGKWAPRRIPNPHYFKDDHPFRMTPIHAVGFELWSMSPRLLFDNLLVTDDPAAAELWAERTFALKRTKMVRDSRTVWARVSRALGGRAGWWAAYGLYVAVPVAAYVAYLLRQAAEESGVDRALQFLAERPTTWVAIVLGLALLLGLAVYLCCWTQDVDIDPKKTDAFVEDDPPEDGEEAAVGAGGGGATPRTGKAQLEPEPEPEPELEQEPDVEAEAEAEPEPSTSDEPAPVDAEGGGDHQRRRKPRRE